MAWSTVVGLGWRGWRGSPGPEPAIGHCWRYFYPLDTPLPTSSPHLPHITTKTIHPTRLPYLETLPYLQTPCENHHLQLQPPPRPPSSSPTMLRTSFRQTAALRPLRCFSTSARAMGEGDTGAPPRMGGQGYVPKNNAGFFLSLHIANCCPSIEPPCGRY